MLQNISEMVKRFRCDHGDWDKKVVARPIEKKHMLGFMLRERWICNRCGCVVYYDDIMDGSEITVRVKRG